MPVANETVYIEVAAGPTDRVSVEPLNMTFDRHNWNISVNVTVSALDDAIDEGSLIYCSVQHEVISSGDPQYATLRGFPTAVDFVVMDNDRAGLQITNRAISLKEGELRDDVRFSIDCLTFQRFFNGFPLVFHRVSTKTRGIVSGLRCLAVVRADCGC